MPKSDTLSIPKVKLKIQRTQKITILPHKNPDTNISDDTKSRSDREKYALGKVLQQRELLNTIIQIQEEERIKIAEALHNGLGQLLYAAKLKIEDICGNEKEKKTIQLFLDEAITETRNLSFLLMPALLKDFGLKVTLEETAKRLSTNTLALSCTIIGLKRRLSDSTEIAVFRIIQELVNNILKHADATVATIFLRKQGKKLVVIVKDNGCGFDVAQNSSAIKGTGLRSVYNRLELINGTMTICSLSGKSTTITVII